MSRQWMTWNFGNTSVVPMVAIGKGTKEPWPKPGQHSLDEVVIDNGF